MAFTDDMTRYKGADALMERVETCIATLARNLKASEGADDDQRVWARGVDPRATAAAIRWDVVLAPAIAGATGDVLDEALQGVVVTALGYLGVRAIVS